jgi:hypothetical protein
VFTVHPNELLKYGSALGGMPRSGRYATTLTNVARDVAGNRMASDFTASFTTLAEHSYSLPIGNRRHIKHPLVGTDATYSSCSEPDGVTKIGDSDADAGYGVLLTFATDMMPALERPEDLLSATLSFSYTEPQSELRGLHAYRIRVEPVEATWSTPILEDIPLMNDGGESVDVLAGLASDLVERTDAQSQYFVRYELATNGDSLEDFAPISCSSMHLAVRYLGP